MNPSAVTSLLHKIASERGYRRRGRVFWKPSADLVLLCNVQKSRWGPGVYINYGVTLAKKMAGSVPVNDGNWGISGRANSLESPCKDVFHRLAEGKASPTTDELEPALRWLLNWMDSHLGDARVLRNALLNMPDDSCVLWDAMVLLFMRAWAKEETEPHLQ